MKSPTPTPGRWLVAFAFALVLVAAACGDDGNDAAATTTTAAHQHGDHDEPVDVSDLDPQPAVTVEVTEDPMSGWNLAFEATGHELAPADASTEDVPGEGHAHLYVDGEKQTRLYTTDYFLGELEPGEHEVAVELSANDHRPLAVDGEVVVDSVTVEVPEADDAGHSHGEKEPIDASAFEPTPTVTLDVTEDPKSGWNLQATFEGHEMAPENVSTEAVEGEGHAHIYVDGEKLTRLYGEWYYLGDLEPGEHEIRVEASANDHSPLAVDGVPVDDTVTIEVTADGGQVDQGNDDADSGEPVATADATIEVVVAGGAASGDTGRQDVSVGDVVLVRVTSDTDDEVHVHGYDLFAELTAGTPAEVQFTADLPGVYEIELEGSGVLLAELAVS